MAVQATLPAALTKAAVAKAGWYSLLTSAGTGLIAGVALGVCVLGVCVVVDAVRKH